MFQASCKTAASSFQGVSCKTPRTPLIRLACAIEMGATRAPPQRRSNDTPIIGCLTPISLFEATAKTRLHLAEQSGNVNEAVRLATLTHEILTATSVDQAGQALFAVAELRNRIS